MHRQAVREPTLDLLGDGAPEATRFRRAALASRFACHPLSVGALRMPTTWTVHRTANERFPFRVCLERDGRLVFAVRAASAWPGPGQQVFCLREDGSDADEPMALVERVPVLHYTQLGRKLAIVLDRPLRKRCEFLFIAKPYRNKPGTYEQVFFRTESGIRSHRSRSRLEVRPNDAELYVVIDSGEKYAWRFPGAQVTTRKLPAGDYALMDGERVAAVVERKSFDNLVSDLGAVQALHHALADLARYDRSAMVVEAHYADFMDDKRLAGRWPASYVARALAEVAVLHPRLPIVFCGNRKLANQWTHRFFVACATHRAAPQLEFVRETAPEGARWERAVSQDEQVRAAVMLEGRGAFALKAVAAELDGVSEGRVRRVVKELEREGKVRCLGRGRGARWQVVGVAEEG